MKFLLSLVHITTTISKRSVIIVIFVVIVTSNVELLLSVPVKKDVGPRWPPRHGSLKS